MDVPYIVPALLPVHRDRSWRARTGCTWSWNGGREEWRDESRDGRDRDAWVSQEEIALRARLDGPYTEVD